MTHRLADTLRNPIFALGIPGGIAALGMLCLLQPGVSALSFVGLWALGTAAICAAYRMRSWSTDGGGWLLLAASVLLAAGVVVNCHYYINVWGNGDVSRPMLMNLDAWSAWNNALVDIGRTDAVRSSWPALGYGHFVGLTARIFGADITFPLLLNALCTLAAIVLTGAAAHGCSGLSEREGARMATCAMVMASLMCYFMVSGTILIKDGPLTMAAGLAVAGALRIRRGADTAGYAALASAAIIFGFCRPIFLLATILLIVVLNSHERRSISAAIPAILIIGIAWWLLQQSEVASNMGRVADTSVSLYTSDASEATQHSFYYRLFHDYFHFPLWQKLLLLPLTIGLQLLIPLPWTYDKYLMFAPDMFVAHFSFCRYAVAALVVYYIFGVAHRKPLSDLLPRLTAVGVLLYAAAALRFGGTVSRYGIPLVPMLIPCAAYVLLHCRRERALRVWCAVYAIGFAVLLFVCYKLTSI